MNSENPDPREALAGSRILVVEDEMLIAMELETLLTEEGAIVLGPANTVARALALLDGTPPDAVLLDLNLNGEAALPVAMALRDQKVPFVTVTAYRDYADNQPELRHVPRADKPIDHREIVRLLLQVLA